MLNGSRVKKVYTRRQVYFQTHQTLGVGLSKVVQISSENPSWRTNKVLYCIVLYCIVLYCIVLYCIVLYCRRVVFHSPPQTPEWNTTLLKTTAWEAIACERRRISGRRLSPPKTETSDGRKYVCVRRLGRLEWAQQTSEFWYKPTSAQILYAYTFRGVLCSGLEIKAGQRTMSGQRKVLSCHWNPWMAGQFVRSFTLVKKILNF